MGQVARFITITLAFCIALGTWRVAAADVSRWRAGPPPATEPSPSAVKEARQRFKKAVKLYEDEGAVDAALAEMQRAYDLAPNFKILYNIGQAARTARDYALALHAYQRFLADGGDKVPTKRRKSVLADIRELKTYVSALDIRVNQDGAEITVNEEPVGVSPLDEPVTVNAGRVRVRATSGSKQDAKTVVVPGGDKILVELELVRSSTAPPPPDQGGDDTEPDDGEPPPGEPDKSNPYLWIGWGLTGALAAGAIITGALAMSNSSDLDDQTYAGKETPEQLTDKQSTVTTLAVTTDVLIGAAALTLVVTTIAALAGWGEVEEEPDETASVRWSLKPLPATPAAGRGPVSDPRWGAAVQGRFQ